jgi:hypothetical protein
MKTNRKRRTQTAPVTFAASLLRPESFLHLRHRKNAMVNNPIPTENQPHPVGFTPPLLAPLTIARHVG